MKSRNKGNVTITSDLDLILQIFPENPESINNSDWIANLVNLIFNTLNLKIQIEPISQGLVVFCKEFQSILAMHKIFSHVSMPKENFEPNGPIWHVKIIQKADVVPFEELFDFLNTIGQTVNGEHFILEATPEQDELTAIFPLNSHLQNYLFELWRSGLLSEEIIEDLKEKDLNFEFEPQE